MRNSPATSLSSDGRWRFVTTDRPLPAVLDPFFRLYDRVFTLAEEREPHDGFVRTLTLNHDSTVQERFGPLSERITLVDDVRTGALLGAMNHVVYALDSPAVRAAGFGPVAAGQLNFLCTDPDHRRQGVAGALLVHLDREVRTMAHAQGWPDTVPGFVTCEQNDPGKMTRSQIDDDVRSSGLSPDARRAWWNRQGFRRLDFRYVQPALVAGGDACEYLDLHLRWCTDGTTRPAGPLPTVWLIEMLRRFFTVSVGKNEGNVQPALDLLRARLTGPTVSIADDLTLIHPMMRRVAQNHTGQ